MQTLLNTNLAAVAVTVETAAALPVCMCCGQVRVPRIIQVNGETVRDLYQVWSEDDGERGPKVLVIELKVPA
jgi:hypothetical protein